MIHGYSFIKIMVMSVEIIEGQSCLFVDLIVSEI